MTVISSSAGGISTVFPVFDSGSAIVGIEAIEKWFRKVLPQPVMATNLDVLPESDLVIFVDGVQLSPLVLAKAARQSVGDALKEIESIKVLTGLSITQLAELFQVTRKTIYDWYDGSAPRSAVAKRIHVLSDVLSSSEVDLSRLKYVWKMPVNGISFIELLNNENMNAPELRNALSDILNELTPRLVSSGLSARQVTRQPGHSLPDIERDADLSGF